MLPDRNFRNIIGKLLENRQTTDKPNPLPNNYPTGKSLFLGGKGNLLLPRALASEKPDTNQTHPNQKDHTSFNGGTFEIRLCPFLFKCVAPNEYAILVEVLEAVAGRVLGKYMGSVASAVF